MHQNDRDFILHSATSILIVVVFLIDQDQLCEVEGELRRTQKVFHFDSFSIYMMSSFARSYNDKMSSIEAPLQGCLSRDGVVIGQQNDEPTNVGCQSVASLKGTYMASQGVRQRCFSVCERVLKCHSHSRRVNTQPQYRCVWQETAVVDVEEVVASFQFENV